MRTIFWRLAPTIISVCAGAVFFFLEPWSGLSVSAMRLMGIFLSLILALLITDLNISIVASIALVVGSLSQSFACIGPNGEIYECKNCESYKKSCSPFGESFEAGLQGFSHEVIWLVFCAFHIGKAVEKTLLGKRISLVLLKFLGRSILGLGYGILLAEVIIAPFVPSNTARGGGIMLPIVQSVVAKLKSVDGLSNSGSFLILLGAHSNLLSSSLFYSGMAANPTVPFKAKEILDIDFTYLDWLMGSIVPGAFAGAILPILLYKLCQEDSISASGAHYSRLNDHDHDDTIVSEGKGEEEVAIDLFDDINNMSTYSTEPGDKLAAIRSQLSLELQVMGSISTSERKLVGVLIVTLLMWLLSSWTRLDTTLVAFCAVIVMLSVKIITWNDVLENVKAWDTVFWLGILIMFSNQLTLLGIGSFLGNKVSSLIISSGVSPTISALLLALVYFYSMLIFSSLTGHIVAFSGPLMKASLAIGISPRLIVALIAYFSTLCGCLTNFSSGPIVIYFSQNLVSRSRWMRVGFIVSIMYVSLYFTIGLLYWKLIGWW